MSGFAAGIRTEAQAARYTPAVLAALALTAVVGLLTVLLAWECIRLDDS